jgi:hypothetical protein
MDGDGAPLAFQQRLAERFIAEHESQLATLRAQLAVITKTSAMVDNYAEALAAANSASDATSVADEEDSEATA